MWTQCTICLSSHHTKRAWEQPSILLIPFFLLSTPFPFFFQLVEKRSLDQANELTASLRACFLFFFCLPSFKTFKSPQAASFPLSSLLFPFPASWPWLQLWKIEKLWLLCHPYSSLVSLLLFLFKFRLTYLYFISAFWLSPLILYLLV